MRLTVSSITLLGSHAVLNGTVDSGVAGVSGTPFNFPVTNEEVYDRTYEPNNTYDFTLGATPQVQPNDVDPTTPQPLPPSTSA